MAKRQLKELFIASMESEEDVDVVEEGTGADSMENDMLEVEEAYQEVESVEEDIEELEEIEEGMEALRTALEASIDDGGLDAQAAVMMHHAVGAYSRRLGMESTEVVPGLESFGGDSGRVAATQVSMENISETLKRIWAAIKAAVEKAIKAVTDFFAKIFGSTGKVKARAAALRKEVEALKKDGATASGDITVPAPNSLAVDGKVDLTSITQGVQNLTDAVDIAVQYAEKAPAAYKAQTDTITELKKAAAADEDGDKAAEAEKSMRDKIKDVFKSVFEEAKKSKGLPLSGDMTIVTKETEDGDDMSLGKRDKAEAVKDAKIDVPSIDGMLKLLTLIDRMVVRLEAADKSVKDTKKAREDAMKAAKEAVDASGRNPVSKVWTNAKAQSALRSVQKDHLRLLTQVASHTFSVSRSALGLVEVAKKQYGKKEEKKDEK